MKILAIETSCDETAVAIVEDGTKIISSVVASSAEMHQKFGGIVPEIASRKQLESIIPVLEEAVKPLSSTTNFELRTMNSIDAIAVTVGPGLIGSLLIGIETAKTLSFALNKPIIPVNHVLAHMYSNFVEIPNQGDQNSNIKNYVTASGNETTLSNHQIKNNNLTIQQFNNKNIQFPAISLVVSGGHTEIYLMKNEKDLKWLGGTIDDAAGECFDKGARILGFGSGGGLAIQNAANKHVIARSLALPDDAAISTIQQSASNYELRTMNYELKLPRPMLHDKTLNFSFSGLKTALMREVKKLSTIQQLNNLTIANLSSELQEAITDVLVTKTITAAEKFHAKSILISGGVASNIRLREKFLLAIKQFNLPAQAGNLTIDLVAPPPQLCTDNAAYIASYAYFRGQPVDWRKITAIPDLSVEV